MKKEKKVGGRHVYVKGRAKGWPVICKATAAKCVSGSE